MRCTNCDTELIPGKKFCHACGTAVTLTCTHCGARIEPGFRFCPDCGTPVGAPAGVEPAVAPVPVQTEGARERRVQSIPEGLAQKIRASKEAVEGERKQVTVMFCDLVGSTAIAERLDPEEYHDLLDQYLEIAFEKIYGVDGIVNQLAGDGVMALFGAPIAHEDAPQRAVRAALGIREALERFNERVRAERGIELLARFGINTGPVVVGTVGNDLKMDYTAIGDTTNLASRLESLAEPGKILVSESTYRLVRGFFEMHEMGPLTVKGKSEPVVAYDVRGISEETTPMAIAAERGLTPFIGRGEELAQLESCYQRLAGHLAQVVAVVGEAGIGKSRLLYEFKKKLASQSPVIFEARCSALNQMVPYTPWAGMMRQYFEIGSNEAPDVTCDKVVRKVHQIDASLDSCSPYLCHVLGVPVPNLADVPADELKRQTFEAMAMLIGAESKRAPAIIVIEDLHWIDDPSQEMLDRAIAELNHGRIMLIVSHRPDYQRTWRTSASFSQLNLRRLSDEDAERIIRALAGAALPAELERLILNKAEGSPFFTEELTRTLIEGGYLVRDNGHHRLTRPVEEIRIPGTVQEVLAARLDRLRPDAKRVLQVAAVMGRQFSREQLEELLKVENIDVVQALDELEQRGVIHRKNLFSRDEFRFGESLTQEVAYEGLLLKQRRQLHERIGQLLEGRTGDISPERSALLAHHFVRSENREKAVQALLRAARDAEQVPSYRTAARFYREAWDLVEPTLGAEPDPDLATHAFEAAYGFSRMLVIYSAEAPDDAEQVIRRARELAVRLEDKERVAQLVTYHGMLVMGERGRFEEGLALVEEALGMAQRAGVPVTALSRALAWGYMLDGRFALALRTAEWVVVEMETAGHKDKLSDLYLGARYGTSRMRFYGDDLDGAIKDAADTYALAVRANNRTVQSGTAATLAHVFFLRGAYAEAKQWADRSLEMAQAIGNANAVRTEAALALAASVELGVPVATTRYLELISQEAAFTGEAALSSHLIVDALLGMGELKRADRAAQLAYANASGRLREMISAIAMGDVLRRGGPAHWNEAGRCYERAITAGEALGARTVLAAARLGAAELAAARGDNDTCARQLHQALTLARPLGLKRYEARAERLLGDLNVSTEYRV